MSTFLSVQNLNKSFGEKPVLRNLSFTLEKGSVAAIMAPSGAGKTTLLRCLCGLEKADSGTIRFFPRSASEAVLQNASAVGSLPKISVVFQEDRLCENLTPIANIQLVLKPSGLMRSYAQMQTEMSSAPSVEDIRAALSALRLQHCADQPVRELSGGERRRVALLRALLAPWDLLLLDEPFKGLDEELRQTAMDYVLAALRSRSAGALVGASSSMTNSAKDFGAVLLVTHDPEEAAYLADTILSL